MTIKYKLTGTDEVVSLASVDPILQVGHAESWPPRGTVMRDVAGPSDYYRIDDPTRTPVVRLWSGSITITDRVSAFLEADITVQRFQYVQERPDAPVRGVELVWNDERERVPLIDHYHVLRRPYDLHHTSTWQRVGGCVRAAVLLDETFDGITPMTYKVRQVFLDPLGDEVHGCGRETDFTVPALPSNRERLYQSGFWGAP